jgi:thiazole/oxazole-forming peptide maturase SagD family component
VNLGSIPVVWASILIGSSKTTFTTLNREVVVEAPRAVVVQLLDACDGNRKLDEVIYVLSQDWDRASIEGLLEELFQKRVIVDGRALGDEFWKTVTNPMQFPTNVSDEDVARLVSQAAKRHRSDNFERAYKPSKSNLSEIISCRKSVRIFSGEAVDFQSVINLLWSAYGEYQATDGRSHRSVPSAGALYPLMIHIALFAKTGDLDPGVYRVLYGQEGSVGFKPVSTDVLKFTRSFLSPAEIQKGTHGVVAISGSFTVSNQKYGNRSMLYVPLEAGHSAQNVLLEAARQGVATLEIGGFVDELLAQSIKLPDEYQPLTLVAFGKEAKWVDSEKPSALQIDWAIPMVKGYVPGFAIASARLSEKRSWSHGRDPSPEMALKKAISETKEWTSCGCIPELIRATYHELDNVIDPREVVRFHKSQYGIKGFPFVQFDEGARYGWTKGLDLEGREFHILADHVYFPYFPETPYYCFSNSSGCAAHPDERVAIETGTLELIERDAFVNSYLCRLDMPIVSENTLPEYIQRRIHDLRDVGFKVWIVDHSLDLAPAVFVMAQSEEYTFTTCASCSSFNVEHAASHALMEVEASVLHRLQHGASARICPDEVIWPNDHGRLYSQKHYFRRADFLVASKKSVSFKEVGGNTSRTWNDLLGCFEGKGWKHLVVPLELSEDYGGNGELSIVRVIVPGTVQMTFGYRQEPAGMRRLYEVAERFGHGKLTYGQLTKFPHPFE